MKISIIRKACNLCALTILISACAYIAYADDQPAPKDKAYSGNIVSIDPANRVIKLQKYLFHKSFVLGENCAFATGDKSTASLSDFRPGQHVIINYVDAHGVLVADRVAQKEMVFTGQVRDIRAGTINVRNVGGNKTFSVGQNCSVLLHHDAKGRLADVKLGDQVSVVYEVPGGQLMARKIEKPSVTFMGTLNSIDYNGQTVTVGEKGHGGKLFRLSDDCAVMVNGKPEGRLEDLKAGQAYELSYDSVNGINVVNRIAPARSQGATEVSERR